MYNEENYLIRIFSKIFKTGVFVYWLIKISILSIAFVGSMCGADRAVIPYDQSKTITFKSLHGFPCLSLTKGGVSYQKLPQEKRDVIRQKIMSTGDECILTLFNVATLLPRELQIRVISELFTCHVKRDELSCNAIDWVSQCNIHYNDEIKMCFDI